MTIGKRVEPEVNPEVVSYWLSGNGVGKDDGGEDGDDDDDGDELERATLMRFG